MVSTLFNPQNGWGGVPTSCSMPSGIEAAETISRPRSGGKLSIYANVSWGSRAFTSSASDSMWG